MIKWFKDLGVAWKIAITIGVVVLVIAVGVACTSISDVIHFIVPVLSSLLAAIAGGFIGAWATRKSVQQNFQNDLKKREIEKQESLQGFYQAILTEVETTWQAYMFSVTGSEFGGIGLELEKLPEEQPFEIRYPFTAESFPVYKANLHMIGQIPDRELRTLIISTYAQAQSIIDSVVYNNSSVSESTECDWMYYRTHEQFYKDKLDAEKKCMVNYAKTMKAQHNEIKKDVKKLLAKLSSVLTENK